MNKSDELAKLLKMVRLEGEDDHALHNRIRRRLTSIAFYTGEKLDGAMFQTFGIKRLEGETDENFLSRVDNFLWRKFEEIENDG